MKKALIVLLILAVAGGLFAQVTFSGSLQTGFAIGFTDEDGDAGKPKLDYIRNRGEHGLRADFNVGFTSAADETFGTWGANATFRGRQNMFSDTNTWAPSVPTANAWWRPNTALYIHLGTGGPGGYGTMGGLDRSQDALDGNGLKIQLTPIAGFSVGGHVVYGQDQNIPAAAPRLFENSQYRFGAKYTATGLLSVAANFKYDAGATDVTNQVSFGAGANFLGLSSVGLSALAADVAMWNVGASNSFLGIGERIEFKALENALVLGARAQQFFGMGDDLGSNIPMLIQGELSYKINNITPAIQARYISGAGPNFNYRNAGELGGVDNTDAFGAKKDFSAIGISPQVTLNVGPEIVLGYNLQMDLTDGATGKTLQHLIYAGVNISF